MWSQRQQRSAAVTGVTPASAAAFERILQAGCCCGCCHPPACLPACLPLGAVASASRFSASRTTSRTVRWCAWHCCVTHVIPQQADPWHVCPTTKGMQHAGPARSQLADPKLCPVPVPPPPVCAGYGEWMSRSQACKDEGKCVVVKITDRSVSPTVCCQQGRTQASSSVVHPVVHCCATPLLPTCSCPCVHANAYSNKRWCCGDMVSCTPRATWVAAQHAHASQAFSWQHGVRRIVPALTTSACGAACCCFCRLSAAQAHLDLGVEAFREVSQKPAGCLCYAS